MYGITLGHGLFLMVILHVARLATWLNASCKTVDSLCAGTNDVEENIPEYAILSLSRIVAANQLIFAYYWMYFHTSVHVLQAR